MFDLDIRDYNRRPIAEQTYANFKSDMNKAYNDYVQKQRIMTKAGGYHSANMIRMNEQIEGLKEQTMSHVTAMTETTTDAITNLANAAQTDWTKLDTLAKMLESQQQMMQQMQNVLLNKVLNNPQPWQPNNRQGQTKKWIHTAILMATRAMQVIQVKLVPTQKRVTREKPRQIIHWEETSDTSKSTRKQKTSDG